jgi:ectoine hydroxylase
MTEAAIRARYDAYPTRLTTTAAPSPIRRATPVVRGDPTELECATGRPDAAQHFADDGFLQLDGFFGVADAAAWADEARRLERWSIAERPPEAFFEPGGALRSLFDVPRFSDRFEKLAREPRLTRIAAALLGDEPYIHQARLNYKPAYTGTGFYWHSDFETWHAEDGMPDMRAVSISIALCDNTAFNGPLLVIPGSHREFVPCVGATPHEHYRESLVEQKIGTPARAQLDRLIQSGGLRMATGPAGSIFVFDCNTLHASSDNLSDAARTNLFLVYNARSNALRAPFAAERCRPDFVAARRCDETQRVAR